MEVFFGCVFFIDLEKQFDGVVVFIDFKIEKLVEEIVVVVEDGEDIFKYFYGFKFVLIFMLFCIVVFFVVFDQIIIVLVLGVIIGYFRSVKDIVCFFLFLSMKKQQLIYLIGLVWICLFFYYYCFVIYVWCCL